MQLFTIWVRGFLAVIHFSSGHDPKKVEDYWPWWRVRDEESSNLKYLP
jgi:hypothetical protein